MLSFKQEKDWTCRGSTKRKKLLYIPMWVTMVTKTLADSFNFVPKIAALLYLAISHAF